MIREPAHLTLLAVELETIGPHPRCDFIYTLRHFPVFGLTVDRFETYSSKNIRCSGKNYVFIDFSVGVSQKKISRTIVVFYTLGGLERKP